MSTWCSRSRTPWSSIPGAFECGSVVHRPPATDADGTRVPPANRRRRHSRAAANRRRPRRRGRGPVVQWRRYDRSQAASPRRQTTRQALLRAARRARKASRPEVYCSHGGLTPSCAETPAGRRGAAVRAASSYLEPERERPERPESPRGPDPQTSTGAEAWFSGSCSADKPALSPQCREVSLVPIVRDELGDGARLLLWAGQR